jgi:hypothetical protein
MSNLSFQMINWNQTLGPILVTFNVITKGWFQFGSRIGPSLKLVPIPQSNPNYVQIIRSIWATNQDRCKH